VFKKQLICIFYFCVFIQLIFSEEVLFRIIYNSPAWINRTAISHLSDSNADIIIPFGSIISDISYPSLNIEINGSLKVGHNSVLFNNVKYSIVANMFVPINTKELFHESFLRSADPNAMFWITSYFLEILRYGNRDIIKPYEQRIVNIAEDYSYLNWFDMHAFWESLIITQSTISIGGLFQDQFLILNIKSIFNGYRVTVTWNSSSMVTLMQNLRSMRINLPDRDTTPVFDLYFLTDGDYLDVYYSTDSNSIDKTFCSSFALIDREMKKQINDIIIIGELAAFAPEKITFWPRRADGGMDIPHHPLTTPLNSSSVFIYNAAIVNVPSFDKSIIENNSAEANADTAENYLVSKDDAKVLPFWVWIVIGGGVVVGVVIVRKRK